MSNILGAHLDLYFEDILLAYVYPEIKKKKKKNNIKRYKESIIQQKSSIDASNDRSKIYQIIESHWRLEISPGDYLLFCNNPFWVDTSLIRHEDEHICYDPSKPRRSLENPLYFTYYVF